MIKPKSTREQELRLMKTQLLKKLQGEGDSSNINTIEKNSSVEKGDFRWKKMVVKTNRKKKEIEELLKSKPLFRRRGNSGSGLRKVNLLDSVEKAQGRQISKLMANEFDDSSLYCPWSDKDDTLASHLRTQMRSPR